MSQDVCIGQWLIDGSWTTARCEFSNRIHHLSACTVPSSCPRFIPAPIDLHVHGGGGADVMQGDDAIYTVLESHRKHGTGALLATSVTAPFESIDRFIASVRRVMSRPSGSGAQLLGVHLEGPFISPEKLGAQPNYPAALDVDKLESWLASGIVRVITYAPEVDPDILVPDLCRRYNVRAQIGHTACDWQIAQQAILQSVGVTHLYNAMGGVHHRQGGAAGAALAYADYAEVITDGIHISEAAFRAAKRAIPYLYSVTDATAASGMPDGQYQLGSLVVEKRGQQVVLPDGTLAGSCCTLLRTFEVLQRWGLDWKAIALMTSTYPARWLKQEYLGVIAEGAWANWIELQDNSAIAIWIQGNRFLLSKDHETN